MALRALLHSHGGSIAEEMHIEGIESDHLLNEGVLHESTLDLRIASIFVILSGAVLFGLPTLLLKQFQSADAPIPRLLRAFAGGVILALALVHIIPEAVGDLNSLIEFPVGGCTILFGIVILVVIDSSLAAFLTPDSDKQQLLDDKHSTHHNGHQHHHSTAADASRTPLNSKDACSKTAELVVVRSNPGSPMIGVSHHDLEADINSSSDDFTSNLTRINSPPPHQHQCLRSLNTDGWLSSAAAPVKNVRQYVTAYTMELGCIFHSVIIGVGVGVITDDRQLVTTLMIALAIHQGLEALALGSVLAITSFPRAKKFTMLMLYSLTTPLGIALGIAISSTYDAESTTSKAVQGTLNGISGGMLLYIGMYQLIAEEFSRQDLLVQPKLRYGMYGSLCMGAALMCILAVWA